MDGLRDDHRDEAMPYGVDTIRLRISFPAAPASRGYNGRAWKMRPLRGWTGGARWDEEAVARAEQGGYADEGVAIPIASGAQQVSAGSSLRATLDRVIAAMSTESPAVEAQGGVRFAGSARSTMIDTKRQPAASNAGMTLSQAGQDALYKREVLRGVSERTHFPGGSSGVTLGPGYDMGSRSSAQITNDLTAIGVDLATAQILAQGAGLHGADARAFATAHRNDATLTEQQQRGLFDRVYPQYVQEVIDNVNVPLNQSQFDAIVSYEYNTGASSFRQSRVLQLLNSNQLAVVPDELNRDNPTPQIGRRAAEAKQFQGF